jgi:hypothetical protein
MRADQPVVSLRAARLCSICNIARANVRRPKTGEHVCKECFFAAFENEIHRTIVDAQLFKPGERVAIAASGGKGREHSTSQCALQCELLTVRFHCTRRSAHGAQRTTQLRIRFVLALCGRRHHRLSR